MNWKLIIIVLFFFTSNGIVWAQSQPFEGEAHKIPGVIEFEDYDEGGEGVGYHDVDGDNQGGVYRADGVDVTTNDDGAGGRYSVGWMEAGEWLQFSVDVKETATYGLKIRGNLEDYLESNPTKISIQVDGSYIAGDQQSSTYENWFGAWSWKGWSTIPKPGEPPILVNLTAGQHVIRVDVVMGGGGGLNYMLFEQVDPLPEPIPAKYPDPNALGRDIFYVSPTGIDSNPGTMTQPWKTLTHAAETASAGNTVYVREGEYNERLVPANSGTVDEYIVFMAYPEENPRINGNGVDIPQLEGLIQVEDKSYIQVSGFRIMNAGVNGEGYWDMGVSIDKANHIIIDHNHIEHVYSLGISTGMGSSQILIDDNTLTDTNFGEDDTEVSLGTFWFAHDIEIRNNEVHSSQGEGIGVAAGPHDVKVHGNTVYDMGLSRSGIGIYIDAWTEDEYNIDVYNNVVRDNESDGISVSSEGGGFLQNIRIFNNQVYDSGSNFGGIGVTNWQNFDISNSTSNPLENIFIFNNSLSASGAGGGIFINNPNPKNVVIKNNIMDGTTCWYSQYDTDGVCLEHFYSDLCTGSACNQYRDQIAQELIASNNLYEIDPKFVSKSQNDYQLQSNSPAIDQAAGVIDAGAGINAPGFDFVNHTRPFGDGYDIGAFEYGSSSIPTPTSFTSPAPTSIPSQSGDANSDGVVDILDYSILITEFGSEGDELRADFNDDGKVDILDYSALVTNFGK